MKHIPLLKLDVQSNNLGQLGISSISQTPAEL